MTVENLNINVRTNADKAAGKLLSLSKAMDSVQSSAKTVSGTKVFEKLGKSVQKTNGVIGTFISSLKRIAMYRVLRSIIKAITSAFSEGLQNAYLFSQGIMSEGHRFAQALDSMSSSSLKMKNQLGSAFISLLAALAPIINQIISLVVKLADVISQIFSAFTGSTYLKAKDVFKSFADNANTGAKAAKEWKNQLLSFDEINRLNEPSQGGGGGGAAALDPSQMFEDTPIAEKWLNIVGKIKEHMGLIKNLAEAIGIAFLAWQLEGFISKLFGLNTTLRQTLGIATAIGGAFLYAKGASDAWVNGVNWDNAISMIGGAALVAVGLGLAFGPVVAAVSLLTTGFGMLVVGIRDWIKTGELSTQTFWLLEAAIAAVGIALGILIGWPVALVAGFVAALGVIIYYWDEIIARIVTAINAIRDFFSIKSINERWSGMQADGSIYLQGFASGGFPDGDLFLANEAGPELVGTMGGRTAVANQQEITEGIAQGVYEAVTSAMSNSGMEVKVYLDSREIKAGQQRLNRAWGV